MIDRFPPNILIMRDKLKSNLKDKIAKLSLLHLGKMIPAKEIAMFIDVYIYAYSVFLTLLFDYSPSDPLSMEVSRWVILESVAISYPGIFLIQG